MSHPLFVHSSYSALLKQNKRQKSKKKTMKKKNREIVWKYKRREGILKIKCPVVNKTVGGITLKCVFFLHTWGLKQHLSKSMNPTNPSDFVCPARREVVCVILVSLETKTFKHKHLDLKNYPIEMSTIRHSCTISCIILLTI